jgi:hypothetical protein
MSFGAYRHGNIASDKTVPSRLAFSTAAASFAI